MMTVGGNRWRPGSGTAVDRPFAAQCGGDVRPFSALAFAKARHRLVPLHCQSSLHRPAALGVISVAESAREVPDSFGPGSALATGARTVVGVHCALNVS